MKKNQRNEMWTRNSVAWIRKKEDQNLRMKLRKYNELWINYDTLCQSQTSILIVDDKVSYGSCKNNELINSIA